MSLSPVPQNIPSNMKSYAFFLFLFSDQFFSVISCFLCALFPRLYHYCSIPLYMLQLINVRACLISCVQLFVTLWTIAYQVPLFMEFSRQEYWSGLPLPPPGDLPDPGIKPVSPALAGRFFTTVPPGKPPVDLYPS